MHIHIIAIGQKMPSWVQEACDQYSQRLMGMGATCQLTQIPLGKRKDPKQSQKMMRTEAELLWAATKKTDHVIALERTGKTFSTEKWAERLSLWQLEGKNISLLLGGPEGHTKETLNKAHEVWSLSSLTLPHTLARIILCEQFYRAFSILNNHPYHRGPSENG